MSGLIGATDQLALRARASAFRRGSHDAARELAPRAEAANRLKDEFLSTVSHEFSHCQLLQCDRESWVHMLRSTRCRRIGAGTPCSSPTAYARVQGSLADLLRRQH